MATSDELKYDLNAELNADLTADLTAKLTAKLTAASLAGDHFTWLDAGLFSNWALPTYLRYLTLPEASAI